MRTRVVVNGVYTWSDNVPAEPLSARGWYMGSLAVPAPRPAKGAGLTPSQEHPENVTPRKKDAA